MKKNFMLFGCALLMSSQLAYAGLVIEGGINGNTNGGGTTSVDIGVGGNGGNGNNGNTGVTVNIEGDNGGPASQLQKDIYASMCASPFMKKYASICQ
jgi:hypothetical protein